MTDTDGTVPVRVIRAVGTVAITEVVQLAALAATEGRCLVIVGIVPIIHRPPMQHSGWQVSLSHCGQPPVVVSVHRLKRHAEEQMGRVQRASGRRDLRDKATFAALIQVLAAYGDGDVE